MYAKYAKFGVLENMAYLVAESAAELVGGDEKCVRE
jgi:hypothetical protein